MSLVKTIIDNTHVPRAKARSLRRLAKGYLRDGDTSGAAKEFALSLQATAEVATAAFGSVRDAATAEVDEIKKDVSHAAELVTRFIEGDSPYHS